MPFVIHKIPNKNLYQVRNSETGKIHSHGTTKKKAEAQVKLLHQITGDGIHSHLKSGITTLIKGRTNYSPYVKSFLNDYGKHQIVSMYIEREPLPELYNTLADYITNNKFSQNKLPYDKLYHLRVVATLDNGEKVVIEKNHSVNVGHYKENVAEGTQQVHINPPFPTLQELVDKTRDKMGIEKFNAYTVSSLNCQNFILNLLRANGLNNENNEKFVIQDVKSVFKDIEYLNTMVDFLTNIASSADVLIQGGGVSDYLPSKQTLYRTAGALATAYLAHKIGTHKYKPATQQQQYKYNLPNKDYEHISSPSPFPKQYSRDEIYIHKPYIPRKDEPFVSKGDIKIDPRQGQLLHHLYRE